MLWGIGVPPNLALIYEPMDWPKLPEVLKDRLRDVHQPYHTHCHGKAAIRSR